MRTLFLYLFLSLCLLALDVQKPKVYHNQDISGWYMSEKLDGIRAYWDGKNLYTKNGNIIHSPKYFTKNFPDFELDGELWTKRNDFENIQSIVLDTKPSKKWKSITYNIFEVPNAKGDFLARLKKAKKWFYSHPNTYIKIIKQIKCKDKKHLEKYLNNIISLNGEGLIVKNALKPYHTGRSSYVFKVKKFLDDEGEVIGYNYKENHKFKSLKIKLKNGTIFNLGGGFSKVQKKNPPKIGDIVTFKYYGLTKNKKPKFASFLRIRKKE